MNSEIEVGVEKAKLLTEALPYIRDFHNKKIVVKFGSSVLKDKETLESVVEDVILLKLIGMEPIIVQEYTVCWRFPSYRWRNYGNYWNGIG